MNIGDVVPLSEGQKKVLKQYVKTQEEATIMMQEGAARMAQAKMNLWLGVKEMVPEIFAQYHLILTKELDVRIDRLKGDDFDWPTAFKELGE